MEWKTVKLGEVGEIVTGKTPSTKNPAFYDHGDILFIGPSDLNSCTKHILSSEKHITLEGRQSLGKNVIPRGAICVSCIGTIGYIGVSSSDCATNQQINSIVVKEGINPDYVYYCMKNMWHVFKSLEGQSTTLSILNKSHFSNLELSLPPIETQRRIAAILSSLDAKIENNNRISANLEAQAQALFKSWFVDFEPFGRVMPEDWKFGSISAFPHILETGRRPKGGAVESGVPSIGAEHIKGMGTYDYSKTKYITEEYARSMKAGKIKGYELLIYKDGGKPGYFIPNFTIYGEGYPFDECYINEHVLKLDFPDKAFNIFCYFYFQEPEVMTYLNAQGGKAAIPGINKSDIENINILSPENEAVKQFGDIVMPYFTTILRNLKENQRLAALRDTLLPKLMKGEIAV